MGVGRRGEGPVRHELGPPTNSRTCTPTRTRPLSCPNCFARLSAMKGGFGVPAGGAEANLHTSGFSRPSKVTTARCPRRRLCHGALPPRRPGVGSRPADRRRAALTHSVHGRAALHQRDCLRHAVVVLYPVESGSDVLQVGGVEATRELSFSCLLPYLAGRRKKGVKPPAVLSPGSLHPDAQLRTLCRVRSEETLQTNRRERVATITRRTCTLNNRAPAKRRLK